MQKCVRVLQFRGATYLPQACALTDQGLKPLTCTILWQSRGSKVYDFNMKYQRTTYIMVSLLLLDTYGNLQWFRFNIDNFCPLALLLVAKMMARREFPRRLNECVCARVEIPPTFRTL